MPAFHTLQPVGYWKQVKSSLGQSVSWCIGEGFYLAVTWVAASIADSVSVSGSGFWPLFWGITAVRWIRPKKVPAFELQAKNIQLLSDMVAAHEKLKNHEFNASLVKSQPHALEIRGAVFNNAIYNILDKRLVREFGACAKQALTR